MELKKGETIMIDAALHLPASFLYKAFSDRSGVPLHFFELYYRGKRLEGEAALTSWGVGKGATIEVKMRGRGGNEETIPVTEGPAEAVGPTDPEVTLTAADAATAAMAVAVEMEMAVPVEGQGGQGGRFWSGAKAAFSGLIWGAAVQPEPQQSEVTAKLKRHSSRWCHSSPHTLASWGAPGAV